MMKIKIYFFGKISDIEPLEKVYQKRVNFNHDLEFCPLPPAGLKNAEESKLKEAQVFLNKIDSQEFIVALDERGEQMTSDVFSDFLMSQQLVSQRLSFVLGGAHGLHEKVLSRVNKKLALGKMVWTKDLARLMLLEQIYRGFEMIKGTHFHKA